MKIKDILSAVLERSGQSKSAIARAAGVSDMTVGKSFRATSPAFETVVRYLDLMGYRLYAVPRSLHVEAISDEAIKIEPNIASEEPAK